MISTHKLCSTRKLVCLVVGFSASIASAQPLSEKLIHQHRVEIAFVLGMAPRMWESPAGFDASNPSLSVQLFFQAKPDDRKSHLFNKRTKMLASALGLIGDSANDTDREKWKTRLYIALHPLLRECFTTYDSRIDLRLEQLEFFRKCDAVAVRAFVVGSYCRFGEGNRIGFMSERRALLVSDCVRFLKPESGTIHLTIAYNYFPGGIRVELESALAEQIAAEAERFLESALMSTGTSPRLTDP